jgi:hypothetical protein
VTTRPVNYFSSLEEMNKGWRLQFIPSKGPFAGQPITRVFVGPTDQERAIVVMQHRYGQESHVLAGKSLDGTSEFGEWDE